MQGGADRVELGLQLAGKDLVGAGELEAVEDRAGVERGAAHQHRRAAAAADVGDGRAGPVLELRDRGRLPDVERVEQVVRDATTLADRRFAVPMSMPR